jgi:hypothetical protein
MKKVFIKKRWKYIVVVIDLVYNAALGLPFYLMDITLFNTAFLVTYFFRDFVSGLFLGDV